MNTNRNRIVLEADGIQVIIDHHPRWGKTTKARVYVSGEAEVDFSEAYARRDAQGAWDRGVDEETDKAFARLNRQVVKNKKALIEEALQTVEGLEELLTDGNKLTFSRTAGCGCGCSPAFVPQTGITHDGLLVESIFISKKKEN